MLLALDTASRMISIALHDGFQVRYEATWHTTNNHTIELTPAIERALRGNQLEPAALTGVAVAQGPGSFTGLRIGMGVAKGLVLAQHIPLVAVPTLDIVAAGAPPFAGTLAAVLQAGRGRICVQRYTASDNHTWTPSGAAEITTWEKLIAGTTQDTLVAGEINAQGRELLESAGTPITIAPGAASLRRAGYLAEIAWQRIRTGAVDDPHTLTPIYLHQPGVPHP